MQRMRTAVLISGRGSNMAALVEACQDPSFPAAVALVVSNEPQAGGLETAQSAGIETAVIDHRGFDGREAFEAEITRVLEDARIDMVCLAGFMRLLTGSFVARWRDRLINIHPSLLPSFKGVHVHERVIEAGVRFSGCTVHYVRPDMDAGPIIAQAVVPVHPDDTSDDLAARVLESEHRVFPLALKLLAEGRCRIRNERVAIEGVAPPAGALINPALDQPTP